MVNPTDDLSNTHNVHLLTLKRFGSMLYATHTDIEVTARSHDSRPSVRPSLRNLCAFPQTTAQIRGPFVKFVDSPYYSESKLCLRCGDGLFFEVPPLASDALLTTLHPVLKKWSYGRFKRNVFVMAE
jgi:hypothetical protein